MFWIQILKSGILNPELGIRNHVVESEIQGLQSIIQGMESKIQEVESK